MKSAKSGSQARSDCGVVHWDGEAVAYDVLPTGQRARPLASCLALLLDFPAAPRLVRCPFGGGGDTHSARRACTSPCSPSCEFSLTSAGCGVGACTAGRSLTRDLRMCSHALVERRQAGGPRSRGVARRVAPCRPGVGTDPSLDLTCFGRAAAAQHSRGSKDVTNPTLSSHPSHSHPSYLIQDGECRQRAPL